MSGPPDALRRIAVLDIGKTNAKLVLFDVESGGEVSARTIPNVVRQDGPYPHFDDAGLKAFFLDGLADLARDGGLDAISITAHGASGALVRGDDLALPLLDYEHDGPDRSAEAYARARPPFEETFSPRLPGGLNLGAQLFWQERTFPAAFGAASAILTYPQYWALWLTGVAATEATSLGAHTDLWDPKRACFSSLVTSMGWTERMAPLRSAFDRLGPVRPDLARRIGLDRPVPVACGIHDSNASLLPHIQRDTGAFSVVSTGTWVIVFALGGAMDRLDPARDTLANVDAHWRPVPSARFMGGREFDLLTNREAAQTDADALRRVLAQEITVLPTFSPGNGPFPHGRGHWSHDPATLTPPERLAAASLYEALMTATCLDLLGAQGRTIIEGPFARNALYCDALAVLSGRAVSAARGSTGTSAGAAGLLTPAIHPSPQTDHDPCAAQAGLDGLNAYAARWRAASVESLRG